MISSVTHVATMAGFHFLQLNNIPLHIFCMFRIHSSIAHCPAGFHFLTMLHCAAVNLYGKESLSYTGFTAFEYLPHSRIAGSYGIFSYLKIAPILHQTF